MTAAHCFSACNNNIIGKKAKHGGEVIGKVVEYDVDLDFAVIEPDSDVSMSDTIVSEQYSILGHYTEDGIEDLRDNNATVSYHGVTTCKTQGEVDGITPNLQESCDFDVEAPRMTTNTDDGDSGGPHYEVETALINSIGIIGPHWGSGSSNSRASGSHICSIRGPAPSGRYRSESSPCSSRSALNARDRGEGHCGADEDGDGRDHPRD
jgi:hypothetical protein